MLHRVILNADLKKLVDDFADYQHACWVFSMQSNGTIYGPEKNASRRHDPNLRPYKALSVQVKGICLFGKGSTRT